MAGDAKRPDRAAAVVLAAGRSTRMGAQNKLLLEIEPGVPLVRRVVERAVDCGFERIFVVTGHEAEAVRAVLADLPVRFVHNADYADGLAGSVRTGFRAAMDGRAPGAVILLGDMPFLPREAVLAVLEAAARGPGTIVQAVHDGRPAHPVWLPAEASALVETLDGDRGVRSLVAESGGRMITVEVSKEAAIDLDTPQDYAAAIGLGKAASRD